MNTELLSRVANASTAPGDSDGTTAAAETIRTRRAGAETGQEPQDICPFGQNS